MNVEHQTVEPRLARQAPAVGGPGLICVLSGPQMWAMAVPPLWAIFQSAPLGSRVVFNTIGTTYALKRTAAMRELLVNTRLEWLLFVDADQTPPADTLLRLLAWNAPIVGGLYVGRGLPHAIMAKRDGAYVAMTEATPPLIEVDWTGMGCVLIRREVFTSDPDGPWFLYDGFGLGEEASLAEHARKLGFKSYLDTTLRVGHITPTSLVPLFVETPATTDTTSGMTELLHGATYDLR